MPKRLDEHKAEANKVANINSYQGHEESIAQSTVHKSAITDHVVDGQYNHVISWNGAKIVIRVIGTKIWIKEAISIRKQGATMNRNEGQYNLSHVYDDLLVDKRPRNTYVSRSSLLIQ